MKSKIKNILRANWNYAVGQILARSVYDKKYLTGKWFNNGKYSKGWEWVTSDAYMNRRMRTNKGARFPVSPSCRVVDYRNIEFDPDDLNNFQSFGIYFQSIGKIKIGKGTYIGPNVGLITANHDPKDMDKHLPPEDIEIGKKCWIGMNSVILPGVKLGDRTIVGAGAVVTRSFEEGHCIIAGNPARIIKELEGTDTSED